MKIITTQYIGDDFIEDASLSLIDSMSQVIFDEYWDELDEDFVNEIQSVFSENNTITGLLTSNSNKSDIKRYIELIRFSKSLPQPLYMTRIEQLNEYLLKHADTLSKYPDIISPVFESILGGFESNELPEPTCLTLIEDPEQLKDFWICFSLRTPISNESVVKLNEYSADFLQKISSKLRTLPPYVSLDYIVKNVKTEADLDELIDVSKIWCDFLLKRGLVDSAIKFIRPKNPEKFNDMMAVFNAMTLAKNRVFVELALAYFSLPKQMIKSIANAFSVDKFKDGMELKNAFDLCQKIQGLHEHSKECLNTILMTSLIETPSQVYDPDSRLNQFVNTVIDKNIDMPAITINNLWKNWTNQRLKNRNDLDTVLDVIILAKCYQAEPKQLFESINNNKEHRIKIMQYLEHGLLNLGDSFKKNCYDLYSKLVNLMIGSQQVLDPGSLPTAHRHQRLLNPLKKIWNLTQEFLRVSKDPYPLEGSQPVANNLSRLNNFDFFAKKREQYNSFWWVNHTRREQADSLFFLVYRAEDYDQILKAILDSRSDILKSDKHSWFTKNTKGHSRLYDITTQLLTHVADEILKNSTISFEYKVKLKQILINEFLKNAKELQDRLPERCKDLKDKIQGKLSEDNVSELANIFDTNRHMIPKSLHYLMIQIDVAVDDEQNMNNNLTL